MLKQFSSHWSFHEHRLRILQKPQSMRRSIARGCRCHYGTASQQEEKLATLLSTSCLLPAPTCHRLTADCRPPVAFCFGSTSRWCVRRNIQIHPSYFIPFLLAFLARDVFTIVFLFRQRTARACSGNKGSAPRAPGRIDLTDGDLNDGRLRYCRL